MPKSVQAGHRGSPAPAMRPLFRAIRGPGGGWPGEEHQQAPSSAPARAIAQGI